MSNKKQVLFVGSFIESGKSGNVGGQMFACRSLINSEISEKVDWTLIDTTADSNLNNPFLLRMIKALKRIIKVIYYLNIKKIDISLIFTSNGSSFIEKGIIGLISRSFGAKVIMAPRSGFITNDIEKGGALKWFINYTFNKVDLIVCQGEKWKIYFSENTTVRMDKFVVIPNWIDFKKYVKSKNLGKPINILFLAWVDRNKGIFELIDALSKITSKQEFRLHIAGDGTAMEELKKVISHLGLTHKVVIHGWVKGDQKYNLLKTSDIFILPSYFEGFPNALLEAMASGIPCIATDVGSVSDLIRDNVNGILVPIKDSKAIALSIEKLLENSNLRFKLGMKARESVEQNYSIDSAVNKFYTLFNLI